MINVFDRKLQYYTGFKQDFKKNKLIISRKKFTIISIVFNKLIISKKKVINGSVNFSIENFSGCHRIQLNFDQVRPQEDKIPPGTR